LNTTTALSVLFPAQLSTRSETLFFPGKRTPFIRVAPKFPPSLWTTVDSRSTALVLGGKGGGETLALRIFNLLHYGHNAQVNALCLVLLGLAVAPLLLVAASVGLAVVMS
jgi:hypothetical protein